MLSKRLLAGAFKLLMVGVKKDSKASDNGCSACQCMLELKDQCAICSQ